MTSSHRLLIIYSPQLGIGERVRSEKTAREENFFWVLCPIPGFMHMDMSALTYETSDNFPNLL
jgi:hypothetical protein